MNSLYPILRKVLVQVTKIATTVLLLIVLIDYFEKLIAFKFESVYEGTIGIDVGIKDFAVCSNGDVFQNPKYLEKISLLPHK